MFTDFPVTIGQSPESSCQATTKWSSLHREPTEKKMFTSLGLQTVQYLISNQKKHSPSFDTYRMLFDGLWDCKRLWSYKQMKETHTRRSMQLFQQGFFGGKQRRTLPDVGSGPQ